MPRPAKLESALSPEEVARFCARLLRTPGGTALGAIIAEARKHGVILNTHSAATVRDGPLAAALANLQAASLQAASVGEVAQDGRDLAGAAAALLVQRLFTKLQDGAELAPRELEQFSRVLGRLQTGINRVRHLEFQLRALQDRLAHREAELSLAREKFARESHPGVAEAIERLRAKCAGIADATNKLDDVIYQVISKRPKDHELDPLRDKATMRYQILERSGYTQSLLSHIRNKSRTRGLFPNPSAAAAGTGVAPDPEKLETGAFKRVQEPSVGFVFKKIILLCSALRNSPLPCLRA